MSILGQQKVESVRDRNGSAEPDSSNQIRIHIRELLSDDYTIRTQSIDRLEPLGAPAAQALVDTLLSRNLPSYAVMTFSQALENIGKASVNPILRAMDHLSELETPEQAFLLESFIVALGKIKDRGTAQSLLAQLKKLRRAIKRNHNGVLVEVCEGARIRIHRILSRMGETTALDDLLKVIGDGRSRVRNGVVQSLHRIGDRRALLPLLRLHQIERSISSSGAQRIREAFRDISRREQVTPENPLFQKLSSSERTELDQMWSKAKNGNGHVKVTT